MQQHSTSSNSIQITPAHASERAPRMADDGLCWRPWWRGGSGVRGGGSARGIGGSGDGGGLAGVGGLRCCLGGGRLGGALSGG